MGCRVDLGGSVFCSAKARRKDFGTVLMLAFQNSGIWLSVPAGMGLSFWLLTGVPCRPFPREQGASYLQRL